MAVCLIVSVHIITSVIRNRKETPTQSLELLKSEGAVEVMAPVFYAEASAV